MVEKILLYYPFVLEKTGLIIGEMDSLLSKLHPVKNYFVLSNEPSADLIGSYDDIFLQTSFDWILFNNSLFNFKNPAFTLKKAIKNLNKNGMIIIVEQKKNQNDFFYAKTFLSLFENLFVLFENAIKDYYVIVARCINE